MKGVAYNIHHSLITRFKFLLTVSSICLLGLTTSFAPKSIIASSIGGGTAIDMIELPDFLRPKPQDNIETQNKTPFGEVLNHDGTLKEGMEGTFDPTGFNMSFSPSGQPVFTRAPLGPGDDRWRAVTPKFTGLSPTGTVHAIAVNGSDIYTGTGYRGDDNERIVMWNGDQWNDMGGISFNYTNGYYQSGIQAVAVSGSNVYVGGQFTGGIVVWNGSVWSTFGSGLNGTVNAITVSGSNVYVGGNFTDAGGNSNADRIAVWNGSSWNSLGTGINNGAVYTIAVSGSNVYSGGSFTSAGGVSNTVNIARWNGISWSALGTGLSGSVWAVTISGSNVYAGGTFLDAGGNVNADRVAVWNGSSWNALGTGINNGYVAAIAVVSSSVYVGGFFTDAGGNPNADNIAMWNGSSWNALATGLTGIVQALAVSGTNVYVGSDNIALWNGNAWITSGTGLSDYVYAMASDNNNSLYVGGSFTDAGNNSNADRIATWNGESWNALGTGISNGQVNAITISGSLVYVGGSFTDAGGNANADRIAVWNGSAWSALGTGINNGAVKAIAVSGSNVYAGGDFVDAGGNANADRVAMWNGSSWIAMGTGVNNLVQAIAVSGSNVYVGGRFSNAGGNATADALAVWNGSAWNSVGTSALYYDYAGENYDARVASIVVSGTNVYVGGSFSNAGGNANADHIAVWNGSNWNAIGSFSSWLSEYFELAEVVYTIAVSDNYVYVGGDFRGASGSANNIAMWNGTTWTALGTGLGEYQSCCFAKGVKSIVASGSNVYAGGSFSGTGDGSVVLSYITQRNGVLPSAVSQNAEAVGSIEAKMKGTVKPGGLPGTCYFEYGLSSGSLSNQTSIQNISGDPEVSVSANVTYTQPNTTIWYRLRVQNAEGTSYGQILSYTFPPEIEVRQGANAIASGSEYDFGNVNYQASSSVIGFTLYNLGLGNLTLTGSAGNHIVKGGAHPADFTVVQSSMTSPIVYNDNKPFTIQFNPSSGGVRTAALTITSNDPDEGSYVINLKGTGVKLNQSITFGALPVKTMGDLPFTLSATATSGLAVSYASGTPSVATVSGNTVTLVGPGTTVITASQAGNANYSPATNVQQTLTVRATEPTAQPTSLTFNSITGNATNGSFTAASGSPSGYLVLRNTSTITDAPVDGTIYTAGTSSIGTSSVIYVGSGTSFTSSGLNSGVVYHYAVFAYNGSGIAINYRQSIPLQNNQSTIVTEPTTQTSAISFSNLNPNTLTVSWISGNGTERLVVARQGSEVSINPNDGSSYTGDPNFSTAADLGSGNKVVYRGSSNSVTVTNLIANTVYHFRVYELNGTGALTNYLLSTAANNPNNRTTLQTEPAAQPIELGFNSVTVSTLGGSFTAATGPPTGYVVLRKQGGASIFTPQDGITYANGIQGDATIVASGSSTNFTDAGLIAGSTYQYSIYSYNGAGQAINYLTLNPLIKSVITISDAPTATSAIDPGQTSFTATWSSVTGATSYLLDVSNDNFINLIDDYSAKPLAGLSDEVIELTPGTTYQYRVRAVNASGISTYSNTISQITIPATPVAEEVINPPATSFVASWGEIAGATGYRLDVSTNNFVTTINDTYDGKEIPAPLTQETVLGLSAGTTYQYRVRAVNAGGTSPNSNTVNVTTSTTPGLTLSVSNPSFINSVTANISVSLSNGSGSRTVKFYSRGILEDTFRPALTITSTSDTYSFALTPSLLDEMGIEFYFTAEDASTFSSGPKRSPENRNDYIYSPITQGEKSIPNLSSGGKVENYRIISIPYNLGSNNTVQEIFFTALDNYDKEKWRLIQYDPLTKKNKDYPAFNRIDLGESYWFNSVEKVDLRIGSGTAPQFNQAIPFTMRLEQGWNQIGSPYPFDLKWSAVQSANPDKAVGKLFVFNPTTQAMIESNDLKAWSGGFVHADNVITDFTYPVTLKNASGGRGESKDPIANTRLDEPDWFIPITLRQGMAETRIGVGMHPQALLSKDHFDEIAAPRFFNYLEMTTTHPDFFSPAFAYDVVPTQSNQTWNFVFNSSFNSSAELEWDPESFGDNEASLILFDEGEKTFVNMRETNRYVIPAHKDYPLKVIYTNKQDWNPGVTFLGNPYPNPTTDQVTIPVALHEPASVRISVYDLTGKIVKVIASDYWEAGIQSMIWQGDDDQSMKVPSAIYLVKMNVGSKQFVQKIIMK